MACDDTIFAHQFFFSAIRTGPRQRLHDISMPVMNVCKQTSTKSENNSAPVAECTSPSKLADKPKKSR